MKYNIQKITYSNSNDYVLCYGEQKNENQNQTKQFTKDIVKYFEKNNYKNVDASHLKSNQAKKPFTNGLKFEWDGYEWIQKNELYS